MKVSTNWLRDYIDIDCTLDELARRLTMAGLEVEETIAFPKDKFIASGGAGLADDTVWDVKITPNRGDWLSLLGVARECAPLVGGKVRMPSPSVEGSDPASSDLIKIRIDAADLCGRYVGVVVRGVTIKESPDWMKDRLIAAGMRPINNVVDITNFVMLELGQPLHAFDYNLLRGSEIIVRRAGQDETITSIDGIERKLRPDTLVIADSERAVAIAGVMGGLDSEISERTQDILIESANFNTVSIRRTAKFLNMVTESSYRFERGVDPSIAPIAALRAAELIMDLAGGTAAKGMVDACPVPVEPANLEVRPVRANAILGTSIDAETMVGYLGGYEIDGRIVGDAIECRVPTFRQDITREIDLIEEIGRAYGYDKFPMTLPRSSMQGKDSREGAFKDKLRRLLISCGGQEVLSHSLVDSKLAEMAGRSDSCVAVRNPLSEELDSMRAMIVPNLLQVIGRNQAYGTPDLSVFEIGKVYYRTAEGEIGEKSTVAGAMIGDLWRSGWGLPAKALHADFFLCKGVVESLLDGLGIYEARYVETRHPLLHPTRGAKILVGDTEVGVLGEASPDVAESLDVRGRPCVFELDFATLMCLAPEVLRARELPRYPALNRHLAVVVADDAKYEHVQRLVTASGKGIVEEVDLLDVYKGEQMGADKRSLTLSIVFRSREKTLTDDEVNAVLAEIREVLSQELGADFR